MGHFRNRTLVDLEKTTNHERPRLLTEPPFISTFFITSLVYGATATGTANFRIHMLDFFFFFYCALLQLVGVNLF